MIVQRRATLDDLARIHGKAELIDGVVEFMPTGRRPGRVALEIAVRLREHARQIGRGEAHGDNVGYAVSELSSGRESFSPDASYYDGPPQADDMKFIEGPPTFAVEVRSEGDYGPAADAEYAAKRADYFEAGTKAVWDVDPVAKTVTGVSADAPANPTIFRVGEQADAESALPGWRVPVAELFG
ncbi:MAG TPA: Uma2 family endonuclease [Gemmataceae bacterium]|jgi:Uma2 family endonuclease|nr:Uma2 family endonuclease [Gemmataceae bacterium]